MSRETVKRTKEDREEGERLGRKRLPSPLGLQAEPGQPSAAQPAPLSCRSSLPFKCSDPSGVKGQGGAGRKVKKGRRSPKVW